MRRAGRSLKVNLPRMRHCFNSRIETAYSGLRSDADKFALAMKCINEGIGVRAPSGPLLSQTFFLRIMNAAIPLMANTAITVPMITYGTMEPSTVGMSCTSFVSA